MQKKRDAIFHRYAKIRTPILSAYIHSIETVVPPFVHQQSDVAKFFLERVEDRRTRKLLERSLAGSGIETRHSVCSEFFSNELFDDRGRASTGERNAVYARESRPLACSVGRKLFENCADISPKGITHLIYASCTGFTNPGPDYFAIEDLGLRPGVQRYVLGSMGCYAAIPAMRLAKHICQSDSSANVLVICLELCSLHLHLDPTYDAVLANSLFGDGAAAVLVSSAPPGEKSTVGASLDFFQTGIIPEGEPDMSWNIGDQGFDLVLSNRIPKIIEGGIGRIVRGIVGLDEVQHWGIHPGGRGILDRVEKELQLAPEDTAVSRDIMRRFGNMAGTTVLFVLKEILEKASRGERTLALAFGPGLTVEAGMLTTYRE